MLGERDSVVVKRLADVLACGHDFALGWLQGAYHTQETWLDELRERNRELQQLCLSKVDRCKPLTVREAQLLNVCRVCFGEPQSRGPDDPFVLNFGNEYAHKKCVRS